MNLGVFNRVNLKDTQGGMYSEWASLSVLIQQGSEESQSVLEKFSPGAGKEVALSIVRQLAANLGITQAAEPSPLCTDKEVQWCMEVICFGLSLPLAEHDTVRDCVNVYCEWLSALYSTPKICVPRPIIDDPNFYARKIISHFHNLFVPRKGEVWPFLYQDLGTDTINRQAVLCHRVLRTLQQIARGPATLERETWESLLLFLIGINDALLAPPATREDVGEQLCERVLGVLLEVWLVACERNFPSPPLWRTLRESCLRWRHRLALVEQWNRVCLALTARLLQIMYGPMFPELKISEEDSQLVPPTMSDEAVAQAWYRLLRTIGDPVDLCRPAVISQTQAFLQYAIASPNVIDPCQHPCLQSLPQIFLKAIKGIAGQVDAFLGVSQACCWEECCVSTITCGSASAGSGGVGWDKSSSKDMTQPSPTPPTQRRLAKSFSVTPSAVTKGIPKASLIGLTTSRVSSTPPILMSNSGPSSASSTTSMTSLVQDIRPPLAPGRPKCNSILHLFGEWLFEAAFIGTDGWTQNLPQPSGASKRPSSVLVEGPSSLQEAINDVPPALCIDRYESGRAEALGALCRIFCAKKTGEEILPIYLSRFYQAMNHGLKVDESRECGETLASILLNSADLFRLDLNGVQVLVPAVISALETVLPEKDLKLKSNVVSKSDLRRASIHLLISILVLPLHFQNLTIKELPTFINSMISEKNHVTFAQLKSKLMNLLINALQVETDSQNTHMLLGALLLSVQDSAAAEEVEQVTQPDTIAHDPTVNLLSSVTSDSASQISISSDQRSLGDTSDITTLQEECIAFDSAHALFVRATYLVCHRLISSWKTDLNISLAALEILSGLARTRIRETARKLTDALECKRAVKWLCDYIAYQCWRPPPAHSKDLHSSIVAAFSCLRTWLTAHSQLLQDKDCLTTVLEVVELGVSGTKSIGKPGEPIKMKDEKELKPASMRVRDAADALLTVILEQVGYFPSACGAQSLSSLLDEVSLLRHCNSWTGGRVPRQAAVERFRYFVAENATILALLEEPLGNDQDPQPTVTVLIRGPFGRHAWTMQLRHLPRHRSSIRSVNTNPGRPLPLAEAAPRTDYKPKFFPDNVDRIPHCKVDESIPSLEAVMNDNDIVRNEHQILSQLLECQMTIETKYSDGNDKISEEKIEECVPPQICHEFQTARLFLSHFGFLNMEPRETNESRNNGLTALDPTIPGFCLDLETLDNISPRTCDTVYIFYVKAGQKTSTEILSNVLHESNVSSNFLEFLNSLGWPVSVSTHAGWTGHISTSWRVTPQLNVPQPAHSDHGGALYNGDTHVLYWADVSSEIAFIVPTQLNNMVNSDSLEETSYCSDVSVNQVWFERNINESTSPRNSGTGQNTMQNSRTMSLDLEKQPSSLTGSNSSNADLNKSRKTTKQVLPVQIDIKIIVVWLESLEDFAHFPIGDLLPCTYSGLEQSKIIQVSDVQVIFLQALSSGLMRVRLQGPVSRINLATPLIDGMVVSRRVLGTLVRQTALNMGRRKRLDNDSYHPPHVRRRLKIQEMVQKYKKDLTEPELLTLLFNSTQTYQI
ncbi:ral GTPase-activating protein subunit beta isoform X1 [Apis mellifera]|uniref:Ral GTPase-activating protein subunit beta isoform X1 n=1 Tax=Apis mellifera TaxID=7460 RepID=A0A7M7GLJ9_APIME|nr:ral GTPase-activating protein subunit beta isoform X1 [Apis mellifera]|eukprot:XP_006558743.1 ral GTPase-activating protein subunit beta isoform X1 [Apis mellifera]